jgi:hypothetical protein
MNVADLALAHDKRQRREKASLLSGEGLARPFNGCASRVVEIAGSMFDGLVVISLENHRALGGVSGNNLDDTACIRTITHEIAEKGKAFRAASSSVTEARIQGFQVAVNVGKQGG